MIKFACPGCSTSFTVADEKAGKTGKCPRCQTQFIIPQPEGVSAGKPSAPPTPSAPPPLPPPSPVPQPSQSPTDEVEIAPCPQCQTSLTVEAQYLGQDVQCPNCSTVFTATRPGKTSPQPPPLPPPAPPKKSRLEDVGRNKSRDDDEDDEDEKPRKKRRFRDDDDEGDDDDDDRPRKKRRYDDDDDDDEDDRPRKKKKRRSRGGKPHRGITILILGILSFVCCGIFTGIPAYFMGKADLAEMDAGRMDDEGRSLTQIGKILGLVNIILTLLTFVGYGILLVVALVAR